MRNKRRWEDLRILCWRRLWCCWWHGWEVTLTLWVQCLLIVDQGIRHRWWTKCGGSRLTILSNNEWYTFATRITYIFRIVFDIGPFHSDILYCSVTYFLLLPVKLVIPKLIHYDGCLFPYHRRLCSLIRLPYLRHHSFLSREYPSSYYQRLRPSKDHTITLCLYPMFPQITVGRVVYCRCVQYSFPQVVTISTTHSTHHSHTVSHIQWPPPVAYQYQYYCIYLLS